MSKNLLSVVAEDLEELEPTPIIRVKATGSTKVNILGKKRKFRRSGKESRLNDERRWQKDHAVELAWLAEE